MGNKVSVSGVDENHKFFVYQESGYTLDWSLHGDIQYIDLTTSKDISYFEKCVFGIHFPTETLLIIKEDKSEIKFTFNCTLIREENVLCIMDQGEAKTVFIIIFCSPECCERAFKAITRVKSRNHPEYQANPENSVEILLSKFFHPIIDGIKNEISGFDDLKTKICKFVFSVEDESKKRIYLDILKANGVINDKDIRNPQYESIPKTCSIRFMFGTYEKDVIVKKPDYRFLIRQRKFKRLIIFDKNDRTLCYEYGKFGREGPLYSCLQCKWIKKKNSLAEVKIDEETGEEYLSVRPHLCGEPKKYKIEPRTVDKPNFNVEEKLLHGRKRKVLTVADDETDGSYNYLWDNKKRKYFCDRCLQQQGKDVIARIRKEELEDGESKDYVELCNEHVCKPL